MFIFLLLGMYMPWAFSKDADGDQIFDPQTGMMAAVPPLKNKNAMRSMIENLDDRYCHCPSGSAGHEVGYDCPGTCLDYVYDRMNVNYSFAFEIYTGSGKRLLSDRYNKAKKKRNLLNISAAAADGVVSGLFQISDFSSSSSLHSLDSMTCFLQFNPTTKSMYESTVKKWSNVLLELANDVADDIEKHHHHHD
jgi:hypothetical protein